MKKVCYHKDESHIVHFNKSWPASGPSKPKIQCEMMKCARTLLNISFPIWQQICSTINHSKFCKHLINKQDFLLSSCCFFCDQLPIHSGLRELLSDQHRIEKNTLDEKKWLILFKSRWWPMSTHCFFSHLLWC